MGTTIRIYGKEDGSENEKAIIDAIRKMRKLGCKLVTTYPVLATGRCFHHIKFRGTPKKGIKDTILYFEEKSVKH